MNTYTHFLSAILEFICIYIPAKSFLRLSLQPKKSDCFACLIVVLLTVIIPSRFSIIIWLLGQLVYMIYVATQNNDILINRLILYCLSYGNVLLTQLLLVFFLSFVPISSQSTFMPILGNFLTIILIIVFFRLFPCYKLYQRILNAAAPYKFLLLNSYLALTSILLFLKLGTHEFYDNLMYLIIILLLIIVTNICILYYDQKLFLQNQELLAYKKNLPIYKSLIDTIRANQHEFSNRIQTFKHLPNVCHDYESICNALQENSCQYNVPLKAYPLLQINMPLLAAALYNLFCIAESLNVHITFDISTTQLKSHAPEYELADFICILTQNAIEACKAEDRIYIRISSNEETIHFEIRNPVENIISHEEITKFFHKNYSTKSQYKSDSRHGFGLYYLLSTLPKYGGSIETNCTVFKNQYMLIFTLEV